MRNPLLLPGVLIPLGICLVPTLQPHPGPVLAGLLACALMAWAGRSWPAAGAACLLLGLLAGTLRAHGPAPDHPGLSVHGKVQAVSGSRVTLDLSSLDGQPAQGPLLLRTFGDQPRVGAHIAAFGPAGPPTQIALPGDPDPAWEAAVSGLHGQLRVAQWVPLSPGRAQPTGEFPHTLHPGLLRALSSGDRSQVDPETEALLRRTGTRHLLAISGLHIGLLALSAAWLARGLALPLHTLRRPWLAAPARFLPAVVGMLAALGFAWMVGSPVSAQRAGWMVCCGLLGNASGRGVRPWNLLGGAAAMVCLLDPGAPAQLGFQLSFGAVAGLLSVTPRLERYLPPDLAWPLRWAARSLFASVGASLGTLPAVAWRFQELPLLSPLANLVAVPLMGAVAVPSALLGALGFRLPTALADGAIEWALRWLTLVDSAPDWTLLHPAVGPLGAALLLAAVLLARWPLTSWGLGLLALGLRERPLQTQVSFLAIGQGDAALVQLPSGQTLLVDAGPPGAHTLRWLRRQGITRVDELLVSHPHPDHYGGMVPILQELDVGALRTVRPPIDGEADYAALIDLAQAQGVPILDKSDPVLDPQRLQLWHPDADFLAQYSHDPNEISLVLALTDQGHTVLFTGDIEDAGERAVAQLELGRVDVLKVAHHGSKTSSDPELLAQLQPRLAVISCGVDNRFGHPHAQTLWAHRAWPILRTDQNGTVQVLLGERLSWRNWTGKWSPWQRVPRRPQRSARAG